MLKLGNGYHSRLANLELLRHSLPDREHSNKSFGREIKIGVEYSIAIKVFIKKQNKECWKVGEILDRLSSFLSAPYIREAKAFFL